MILPLVPLTFFSVQADESAVLEQLESTLQDPACWQSRFDVLRSLIGYRPSSAAVANHDDDDIAASDRASLHQPTESVEVVVGLVKVILERCGL